MGAKRSLQLGRDYNNAGWSEYLANGRLFLAGISGRLDYAR